MLFNSMHWAFALQAVIPFLQKARPLESACRFRKSRYCWRTKKSAVSIGLLPQDMNGDEKLRGLGMPSEKSLELLSLSTHPSNFLNAAIVLVNVGAGPLPSKQPAAPP